MFRWSFQAFLLSQKLPISGENTSMHSRVTPVAILIGPFSENIKVTIPLIMSKIVSWTDGEEVRRNVINFEPAVVTVIGLDVLRNSLHQDFSSWPISPSFFFSLYVHENFWLQTQCNVWKEHASLHLAQKRSNAQSMSFPSLCCHPYQTTPKL